MDFNGLKEYRTFVDKSLEKVYRKLLKNTVSLYLQEQPEEDPYMLSREVFPRIKTSFPNFMPKMSKDHMNNLSDKEINIILSRLSKYKF